MSAEPPVRVLFFENDRELTEVMTERWNQRGITVVGAAATVTEMYWLVQKTSFDVAVLDVRIPGEPGLPGLGIARWLLAYRPEVAVLVYTNHDDEDGAAQLFRADRPSGVGRDRKGVGYLVKERAIDLPTQIRRVYAGEDLIDDGLRVAMGRHAGRAPHPLLTPQQDKAMQLLVQGYTNKDIATACGIKPGTVADYLSAVFRKLDVLEGRNSRVTAAVYYVRHHDHFQQLSEEPMIEWPEPTGD